MVWNIFYFPIYWRESSQLTNSYFSKGWFNHQPVMRGFLPGCERILRFHLPTFTRFSIIYRWRQNNRLAEHELHIVTLYIYIYIYRDQIALEDGIMWSIRKIQRFQWASWFWPNVPGSRRCLSLWCLEPNRHDVGALGDPGTHFASGPAVVVQELRPRTHYDNQQKYSGWWFGTYFSHILGMSSSQLTFIFFRGVVQPRTSIV